MSSRKSEEKQRFCHGAQHGGQYWLLDKSWSADLACRKVGGEEGEEHCRGGVREEVGELARCLMAVKGGTKTQGNKFALSLFIWIVLEQYTRVGHTSPACANLR